MVDLSACQITAAGDLTRSLWRLLNLLLQPTSILPVLAVMIAAPWIVRPRRWKRRISLAGVLLVLLYSLGLSPLRIQMGGKGLALLIPRDGGQPADAIVVLGRGGDFRPSRVQVAAELWQQQRAPLVFASGRSDAKEIGQMLKATGLPAEAIDGEPCSATTNENALFTAALLQPRGIRRLILVTDPPHMARSLLTFRSLGFEVTPHPSPIPRSLDNRKRQFLVLREWAGLIGYGMMGRYFARETGEPGFGA
ncbi:ElyC/SanA/YdcF family protein [Nodosilinea sp. FACHB-13]|uniref:ElyC/SanA/YdcF family protein n=1 Tax=Cyanophyceae TaxID=3028117 RepID=UPI0016852E4F|nr:YdcF family protein [Nodosilinea sp. FACHB-13]